MKSLKKDLRYKLWGPGCLWGNDSWNPGPFACRIEDTISLGVSFFSFCKIDKTVYRPLYASTLELRRMIHGTLEENE